MIKALAVDMDGTFLNSKKDYNRPLFKKLYDKMKDYGIKFIVASGNQYVQLKRSFPEICNEISYVAENGSCVMEGEKILFKKTISRDDVLFTASVLDEYDDVNYAACGFKSTYYLNRADDHFEKIMDFYCPVNQRLDTFEEMPEDDIFKMTLECPAEKTAEYLEIMRNSLAGKLEATSSGHGSIDLIIPGCHKAYGLKKLLNYYKIDAKDLMACGDGGNDIEMLALAGHSYAMANGSDEVKRVAKYQAATNDEDGVLHALKKELNL